ncbi:MAG: helix-turn-helix transcriptional regulator [Clostridiales bacterium]|nr:helix-turn-helix transcriptional regulator [Clostridiales bacterium]
MIGDRLRFLRKSARLSQSQIASLLEIDRSTYSYYETDKTLPSINLLIKISKIYSITIDELIGNNNTLSFYDSGSVLVKETAQSENDEFLEKIVKLSDLNDDEKMLVLKYRLMEDKTEITKFFEEK